MPTPNENILQTIRAEHDIIRALQDLVSQTEGHTGARRQLWFRLKTELFAHARAEEAVLTPVVKKLSDSGLTVTTALKYGNIAEVLIDIAKAENAEMVVIGRTGHSGLSTRIFGSVAGTLAQAAPVPVVIVP